MENCLFLSDVDCNGLFTATIFTVASKMKSVRPYIIQASSTSTSRRSFLAAPVSIRLTTLCRSTTNQLSTLYCPTTCCCGSTDNVMTGGVPCAPDVTTTELSLTLLIFEKNTPFHQDRTRNSHCYNYHNTDSSIHIYPPYYIENSSLCILVRGTPLS